MSTIELVDPELRDALALWPLPPLTAESLTQRRANALDLIGAVPKPYLPDIATDEIHVGHLRNKRNGPSFFYSIKKEGTPASPRARTADGKCGWMMRREAPVVTSAANP